VGDGQRNVLEPDRLQAGPELREAQGAGDATRVGAALGAFGWREGVVGDDVGDADPSPRPQDAGDLAEDRRLVGSEINDAVADDDVNRGRREWNGFDVTAQPLDVGGSGGGRVALSQGQHLVGHVQAEGTAGWPDALGRQQDVDAAA
jgi:hypothetical protein